MNYYSYTPLRNRKVATKHTPTPTRPHTHTHTHTHTGDFRVHSIQPAISIHIYLHPALSVRRGGMNIRTIQFTAAAKSLPAISLKAGTFQTLARFTGVLALPKPHVTHELPNLPSPGLLNSFAKSATESSV